MRFASEPLLANLRGAAKAEIAIASGSRRSRARLKVGLALPRQRPLSTHFGLWTGSHLKRKIGA